MVFNYDEFCKTFWSIQTKLIFYIEDFKVFAGNWTLVLCDSLRSWRYCKRTQNQVLTSTRLPYRQLRRLTLWKKSVPVAQDLLLCSDWSRALFASLNTYTEQWKTAFFAGNQKSLSSPERIGFLSVATVWFSFHWLFWLLGSASFMFSSATWIFLSLLHA